MKRTEPKSTYAIIRDWTLHELRRVRAAERVGSMTAATAQKVRKVFQSDLATIRHTHANRKD